MDINSLLSPQESPRMVPPPPESLPVKTTAKKSRKPRASKVSHPSPLVHTTVPSPPIPHVSTVRPQHAVPPPTDSSPTQTHRMSVGSAVGNPPADSNIRTNRQPSTAGMDTLAELASMQHHQQTARANAGGLRSAQIVEHPATSASVIPSLLAMSRQQTSGQPHESHQLRGGSLDFAMTDGSPDPRSPRKYSTTALSSGDSETVTQLANHLVTNPFAYDSHVQLINILHHALVALARSDPRSHNLFQELHVARETMNAKFALGEDLWEDWVQDQILLAKSPEDHITVVEFCERAVGEEPNSTKLWNSYGRFILSTYKNAHPEDQRVAGIEVPQGGCTWSDEDLMVAKDVFTWEQMMDVWKRGFEATMWRFNDSHLLWDTYTDLLLQELATSPSYEAFAQAQSHFITRLQTPHSTWEMTLEAYSSFVSRYDNANYENTMVVATRLGAEAKGKSHAREVMEASLLRASQANDLSESRTYQEYLDWEISQSRRKNIFDFELARALYERATLRFPAATELWEGYAMFLIEELSHDHKDASPFPVLAKATRHCPWSGALWSLYLLAAENRNLSFMEVEDIKHRATSSGILDAGGMEEVLKIHTAWCGYLRRRAIHPDSTDEDFDVAEVGIRSAIENMENLGKEKYGKDYQGDPEYRLEKIYIKCLSQGRYWDNAREQLKKLIPRKGDSYDFWLRYYLWEMGTWGKLAFSEKGYNAKQLSKPTEATKVLARAMARPNLDWPEKIIETYQHHCEDNEDAEELQSAIARIWKAKQAVRKRREREAYEAYEAAQAQAMEQQQQAQSNVADECTGGENISKRKRDDDADAGMSKKIRPEVSEEVEPQVEEQHPSAPSLQKRDRENATIVVKNLPVETTDTRLRQYFRDCGTINSLKLMPERDGESATASIEFDSKEDVLTAQTKDRKTFDGRAIEVQLGSGSTLYVCNFPATADEAWIRTKFSTFGEIVDIRFPSLKYNTHRRFCYVQFKSASAAQAATQLDGEDLGGEMRFLAKISDPNHKQERQGAIYEGRELFLANLDREATKGDVRRAFSKYGTVENVRIPKKVDGSSKGIGFVVFSKPVGSPNTPSSNAQANNLQDEAEAALEMNLTQFKQRVLNVMLSTNDKAKRQEMRIITSASRRSTASPAPDHHPATPNGNKNNATSPTPSAAPQSKYAEMQSRTIVLLNIPDTINEARIRAIAEPYGELLKVSLRLDHQGVILEYKDVASTGKASLGLEGQEIVPGRPIGVGTVEEMKQQKAEWRSDRVAVGAAARKAAAKLQGPTQIRRPNQSGGTRRGGKGGLGVKRGGVGLSGERANDGGIGEGVEDGGRGKGGKKSNADFKAMLLK